MTLPPKAAIAYFKAKGYQVTDSWRELWQKAHARAFTVARCAKLDVLADIRAALDTAMAEGITYREFLKQLRPQLEAKGWWGQAIDKETGEIVEHYEDSSRPVEYGSPRRLKTIYQTNLQTAYMAGRYRTLKDSTDSHPYWQYVAVMDKRTRPSHAAMNGRVFGHDDGIWGTHFPPNGFNCRCRVRPVSEGSMKREGLFLSDSTGHTREIEVPISKRKPAAGSTIVTAYQGPGMDKPFAPDPGWNYNPGEHGERLAELEAQKLAAAAPAIQAAHRKESGGG